MRAYTQMYSRLRNERMMQTINALLYTSGRQMPESDRTAFMRRMNEDLYDGPRKAPRVSPGFLRHAGIRMEPNIPTQESNEDGGQV